MNATKTLNERLDDAVPVRGPLVLGAAQIDPRDARKQPVKLRVLAVEGALERLPLRRAHRKVDRAGHDDVATAALAVPRIRRPRGTRVEQERWRHGRCQQHLRDDREPTKGTTVCVF